MIEKLVNVLFFSSFILLEHPAFAASTYTAGEYDTVYGVAYKHNIPTHAIISANNLKPPYLLKKGQELTIPAAGEHIVGNGESLQGIAELYGVKVDILAQENGIQAPFFASPGTHLMIPARDTESLAEALKPPTQDTGITTSSLEPLPLIKEAPKQTNPWSSLAPLPPVVADSSKESTSPTISQELAAEIAAEKKQGAPLASSTVPPPLKGNLAEKKEKQDHPKKLAAQSKKEAKIVAKKEEPKAAPPKETDFIWPVEGAVIGKFEKGGKNDGINIRVPEGTPVKASADGEVIYAGNELKGFGDLVLIKHKDGWITAYAHNSSLAVKKGETVKQGQKIAKSGNSGDVKEAQVHFEIRKGKQAVDPLPKLGS